jgi:hypothetical protein
VGADESEGAGACVSFGDARGGGSRSAGFGEREGGEREAWAVPSTEGGFGVPAEEQKGACTKVQILTQ